MLLGSPWMHDLQPREALQPRGRVNERWFARSELRAKPKPGAGLRALRTVGVSVFWGPVWYQGARTSSLTPFSSDTLEPTSKV